MSERLPVIYVAGPYRAATPWRIQQNIRAAQEVALAIWKLGAVALCPHANTALFDGEAPDEIWLQGDLELLRRCDALLAMPSVLASKGAMAECKFAKLHNIPIFGPELTQMELTLALETWIEVWKERARTE
jgi:hypothetical protein